MARRTGLSTISPKIMLVGAGFCVLVCAPAGTLWAQHSAGHAGAGGHFGGGQSSAPHLSAPPAAPHFSAPPHFSGGVHVPAAPGVNGGARGFAAPPPAVHLVIPPAAARPVVGNAVGGAAASGAGSSIGAAAMPGTVRSVGPHVTIGYPPSQGAAFQGPASRGFTTVPAPFYGTRARESGTLRFSGEGHEIWREPSADAGPAANMHPRRPVSPLQGWGRGPRYVIRSGFGGPFVGFGWAGGGLWWGSAWAPGTCDPYWAGGIGCGGAFLYNDYLYGNYGGGAYGPANPESQVDAQPYENSAAPPVSYGAAGEQLVQLYLKDGRVYEVADYWLVNGNDLHFTTVDANGNETEHAVSFDQLDLQKTIGVNTDRGFRFVLRDEPMREYLEGTEQHGGQGGDAGAPALPK